MKGQNLIQNLKGLVKQLIMDPPAMETGPKMLLKAVGHHRILVGGLLFTPLADVQLTGAL